MDGDDSIVELISISAVDAASGAVVTLQLASNARCVELKWLFLSEFFRIEFRSDSFQNGHLLNTNCRLIQRDFQNHFNKCLVRSVRDLGDALCKELSSHLQRKDDIGDRLLLCVDGASDAAPLVLDESFSLVRTIPSRLCLAAENDQRPRFLACGRPTILSHTRKRRSSSSTCARSPPPHPRRAPRRGAARPRATSPRAAARTTTTTTTTTAPPPSFSGAPPPQTPPPPPRSPHRPGGCRPPPSGPRTAPRR